MKISENTCFYGGKSSERLVTVILLHNRLVFESTRLPRERYDSMEYHHHPYLDTVADQLKGSPVEMVFPHFQGNWHITDEGIIYKEIGELRVILNPLATGFFIESRGVSRTLVKLDSSIVINHMVVSLSNIYHFHQIISRIPGKKRLTVTAKVPTKKKDVIRVWCKPSKLCKQCLYKKHVLTCLSKEYFTL